MKKLILLACCISFSAFASNTHDREVTALYQELCAKEQDPVKRQNYCYLFENSQHEYTNANVFRQDTAVV